MFVQLLASYTLTRRNSNSKDCKHVLCQQVLLASLCDWARRKLVRRHWTIRRAVAWAAGKWRIKGTGMGTGIKGGGVDKTDTEEASLDKTPTKKKLASSSRRRGFKSSLKLSQTSFPALVLSLSLSLSIFPLSYNRVSLALPDVSVYLNRESYTGRKSANVTACSNRSPSLSLMSPSSETMGTLVFFMTWYTTFIYSSCLPVFSFRLTKGC